MQSDNMNTAANIPLPLLSKRLLAVADMIDQGSRIADVGTDHGFVPIYLAGSGRIEHAVAMDVRKGPLERAQQHVAEYGLGDRIETRLSDGLAELAEGEADEMICAGMGGPLMQRILDAGCPEKKGLKVLVLEPQSDILSFRAYLRSRNYGILAERFLEEDGKFYPVIKVSVQQADNAYEKAAALFSDMQLEPLQVQRICDRFGPYILLEKGEDLYRYLVHGNEVCDTILAKITEKKASHMERFWTVSEEKEDILTVLKIYN